MKMGISNQEATEIFISVVAISLAMTIASAGLGILAHPEELVMIASFFLLAVGTGFILHEMAHKFTAMMFGAYAQFHMWTQGILFMFVMSLMGFLFAAPGAVYIYERLTREQNGIVSIAGPATNIVLAIIFLGLAVAIPTNSVELGVNVWAWAAKINIFLALFNLIPIPPLDGSKVLAWNIFIYIGFAALTLGMYLLV